MMNLSAISVPILGVDRFSKVFGRSVSAANANSKTLNSLANKNAQRAKKSGQALTRNVTLPVSIGIAAIVRQGYGFQKFINQVEAKSTVAGTSIAQLRQQAKDLGAINPFSHTAIAEGMGFLAQAGFDTDEIFQSIEPTLQLAAATSSDLGSTADWLSNIIRGFGLETKDAADIAGVLAMTAAKSNVSLQQIAKTFEKTAPMAKAYGATLKETALYTGLLGNAGIQGSKGATALTNMFARLAAEPKAAEKRLKSLGITTADMAGNMRPLTEIMNDLFASLEGKGTKKALTAFKDIFGMRAGPGALVLADALNDPKMSFVALMDDINRADRASLKKMMDVQQQGIKGDVDNLVSAFQGMGQELGDSGIIKDVGAIMRSLTNTMREINQVSPTTLKMFTGLAIALAALGPLAIILGQATIAITGFASALAFLSTTWIGTAVGVTLLDIGAALSAFAGGAIAASIAAISAAVLGMVSAFTALYAAYGLVSDIFQGAANNENNAKMSEQWTTAQGGLTESAKGLIQSEPELFKKFFSASGTREDREKAKAMMGFSGTTNNPFFKDQQKNILDVVNPALDAKRQAELGGMTAAVQTPEQLAGGIGSGANDAIANLPSLNVVVEDKRVLVSMYDQEVAVAIPGGSNMATGYQGM